MFVLMFFARFLSLLDCSSCTPAHRYSTHKVAWKGLESLPSAFCQHSGLEAENDCVHVSESWDGEK